MLHLEVRNPSKYLVKATPTPSKCDRAEPRIPQNLKRTGKSDPDPFKSVIGVHPEAKKTMKILSKSDPDPLKV